MTTEDQCKAIDELVVAETAKRSHYIVKIGDIVLSHREKMSHATKMRDEIRKAIKVKLGLAVEGTDEDI